MRKCALLLTICWLGLLSLAAAQTAPKDGRSKHAAAARAVDKATLQSVMTAWVTLDPANVAKYYDKTPNDVFYDLAPLKYNGWAEYAKGVMALFNTLQSAKANVNDDAVVHHSGTLAWATATVHFEMTPKAGSPSATECRWTTVWEHKNGGWFIVHEHFSAPLPEPK